MRAAGSFRTLVVARRRRLRPQWCEATSRTPPHLCSRWSSSASGGAPMPRGLLCLHVVVEPTGAPSDIGRRILRIGLLAVPARNRNATSFPPKGGLSCCGRRPTYSNLPRPPAAVSRGDATARTAALLRWRRLRRCRGRSLGWVVRWTARAPRFCWRLARPPRRPNHMRLAFCQVDEVLLYDRRIVPPATGHPDPWGTFAPLVNPVPRATVERLTISAAQPADFGVVDAALEEGGRLRLVFGHSHLPEKTPASSRSRFSSFSEGERFVLPSSCAVRQAFRFVPIRPAPLNRWPACWMGSQP